MLMYQQYIIYMYNFMTGESNCFTICFLGFYNAINEITYDNLTNTGFSQHPYLKKAVINPSLLTNICLNSFNCDQFGSKFYFYIFWHVINSGQILQVIPSRSAVVQKWTCTNTPRITHNAYISISVPANTHAFLFFNIYDFDSRNLAMHGKN
ncbi:hypothetical protein OSB04_009508 [Centaurea solstitialis]|uniref:Uncharacterized protein n=1 Tax=Centaurea solstitialis TaxID=347529 RepID=A0AA38T5S3_9ASTR|nr:hypothetical protein OSB04_009508 [Centaurea solstitialis]